MCGLAATFHGRDPRPFLFDAAERMEARGYDSWGYCVLDGRLEEKRWLGAPSESRFAWAPRETTTAVGLVHTRWASQGGVSLANTHPVRGGEYVRLVHNGTITNYKRLRAMLEEKGYSFLTQTDTEAVAHLADHLVTGANHHCLKAVCDLLEGEYAFAFVHTLLPGWVFAASFGSPLVASPDGYLASDVNALAGYTDRAYRFRRGTVAVLHRDHFPLTGEEVAVPRLAQPTTPADGRPHMCREIGEQADCLLADHDPPRLSLERTDKVVLFGCGSSYHAALLGRYYLEDVAGVPAQVEYATEVAERNIFVSPDTAWVALTQSGETRDTVLALEKVVRPWDGLRPSVYVVTNGEHSQAASLGATNVFLGCGPELGVAATKTFTMQVARLMEMAYDEEMDFSPLSRAVQQVISRWDELHDLSRLLAPYRHMLYLARGYLYPVALEGALKMKEVAYRHAEAIQSSEMKHGPIALVDDHTVSVFLMSHKDSPFADKIFQHVEEIRARKGRVLAVCDAESARKVGGSCFVVPDVDAHFYPLVVNVVLQILAYEVAVADGINPDKPRNLAKALTVE